LFAKILNFSLVKSSSIDQLSGADPDPIGNAAILNTNVQIEPITNKQRRDKMTNKNQQDEEEERGKILTMKFSLKTKSLYS